MVDVKSSNAKLIDRARRIFRTVLVPLTQSPLSITPSIDIADDAAVDRLIKDCGGSVKTAIVAARWGHGVDDAIERLEVSEGGLKRSLKI